MPTFKVGVKCTVHPEDKSVENRWTVRHFIVTVPEREIFPGSLAHDQAIAVAKATAWEQIRWDSFEIYSMDLLDSVYEIE